MFHSFIQSNPSACLVQIIGIVSSTARLAANSLIDTFIEKGFIKAGEPVQDVYKKMLIDMLEEEIRLKLNKANKKAKGINA